MKYRLPTILTALVFSVACGESGDEPAPTQQVEVDPRLAEELDIGERNEPGSTKEDNFSHNGEEDFSELCKPIPDVEPLVDPEITISIDGRTLHLVDRGGDYDAVFPVGLGKIGSSGSSLTPVSTSRPDEVFYARADVAPAIDGATPATRKWAWNYSCRIWSGSKYYNPRSGRDEYRSYFAGLPFIRLDGPRTAAYGIHGPIDNYWRENGGELYSGYVSGGCIRMEADDLVEVFARINGSKTPVRIQQDVERPSEDALAVDDDRFINSECLVDEDCADEGTVCVPHPGGGRSFCTKPCETQVDCPIRENDIVGSIGIWSYCVADTHDLVATSGMCAIEGNTKTNNRCKSYDNDFRQSREDVIEGPIPATYVCVP